MVDGTATVTFRARGGTTRLAHLYQSDPLRMLFPRDEPYEPATGVLVTTSGGLVGGDRLTVDVCSRDGAAGRVLGQAAEKIYRSAGDDCRINVRLQVERSGWLEWLPQETIVFDRARLRRLTVAEVAPGAQLLAGEIIVFGRTAMGERMTEGMVREAWDVYRDGRLVWADAVHIDDGLRATLDAPSGFDGAVAFASLIYVGDDAADQIEPARALIGSVQTEDLRAGASVLGDVLVVRWLGRDARCLRLAYGDFWGRFRHCVGGYPPVMPRLWRI